MFLVRSAADIMERDVLVLEETTSYASFRQMAAAQGGAQHVVVTRGGTIIGGIFVDAELRLALEATASEVKLKALVQPRFTVVHESDVAFDVIKKLSKSRATMAIVISGTPSRTEQTVLGVITKDHLADTVARSVEIYPG